MRTAVASPLLGQNCLPSISMHTNFPTVQRCCQCHCSSKSNLSMHLIARQCAATASRTQHTIQASLLRFQFIRSRGLRTSTFTPHSLALRHNAGSNSVGIPTVKDLDEPPPAFDSIESALEDMALGKFVVVLDDEDRENEGDLIIAADLVTTEAMAFMVEYTSGVICVGMEGTDLDRLRLPLMVDSTENEEALRTAFTVTVDLKEGITTGISASDRALTIRALSNPCTCPEHLRRPGHIFPLRCREGGVLTRPGHTEAAVDLARLARRFPAGVLCEIVNKSDGSMARTPDLLNFAREHDLKCITIADLILYRLNNAPTMQP